MYTLSISTSVIHGFTCNTVNWCGQWFEYFPNPPLNVLAMVENLLAHHDAELLEHFVRHSITTQVSPSI